MSKNNNVQINAEDARELIKRAYNKNLETVCPSETIRDAAKQIAEEGNDPCGVCAYSSESEGCVAPYSDECLEEFDIDACYDGILKLLSRKMGYIPEIDEGFTEDETEDFTENGDN